MTQLISKEKIEALQSGNIEIKLIDIRTVPEFEKIHVPGSVNIPAETLQNHIPFLPDDVTIVCICNKGHERSQNAAALLFDAGFSNAFYLEGGVLGWLDDSND